MSIDLAVLTVIGPELHAVQSILGCNDTTDRLREDGTLYWKVKIPSQLASRDLDIVIHCIGSAGNQASATATTQVISRWSPKAILLVGIAAGRRGTCKIGDVVTPRVVVDDTEKVAISGELKGRPKIAPPPYPIRQMVQAFRFDQDEFQRIYRQLFPKPIRAPRGQGTLYNQHVAKLPTHLEAGINSADILLRDPEILNKQASEVHQQIKIGEMEGAGLITAAQHNRATPVPWFIIRGVSDFGDDFKNDRFHEQASCAAAAYLAHFLDVGFDVQLLEDGSSTPTTTGTLGTLPPQAITVIHNGNNIAKGGIAAAHVDQRGSSFVFGSEPAKDKE